MQMTLDDCYYAELRGESLLLIPCTQDLLRSSCWARLRPIPLPGKRY